MGRKTLIRITIDIFSGRTNPFIELKGDNAFDILNRLKPTRRLKKEEVRNFPSSTLGYRGLIIEQLGVKYRELPRIFRFVDGSLFGPGLSHIAREEDFEDRFFNPEGPIRFIKPKDRFLRLLKEELERYRHLREYYKILIRVPLSTFNPCRCHPPYDLDWWNQGRSNAIQNCNNCYNYGCNYRTDTFAQPGLAAGAMYSSISCSAVKEAAELDGLLDRPDANNKCPVEGHLTALVIAPDLDFHWYRKSKTGYWSHKPGGTPATTFDNSGELIRDPRLANRGMYTEFCTFMVVLHGHIKLK